MKTSLSGRQYRESLSGNRRSPRRVGGAGRLGAGRGGKVAAQLGQLCWVTGWQGAETAPPPPLPRRGERTRAPGLVPKVMLKLTRGGQDGRGREEQAGRGPGQRVHAEPQKAALHPRPRPWKGSPRPGTLHPKMPTRRPTGPPTILAARGRGSGKRDRRAGERQPRKGRRPLRASRTLSSSMSRFVDLSMERN